jgi:hypothetical protein
MGFQRNFTSLLERRLVVAEVDNSAEIHDDAEDGCGTWS